MRAQAGVLDVLYIQCGRLSKTFVCVPLVTGATPCLIGPIHTDRIANTGNIMVRSQ